MRPRLYVVGALSSLIVAGLAFAKFGGTNFGGAAHPRVQVAGTEQVGVVAVNYGTGLSGSLASGVLAITTTGGAPVTGVTAGTGLTGGGAGGALTLNVGAGTGITANANDVALTVPVTVALGGLGITSTPTNGQLPIGNGTNYVAAVLTNGGGITYTGGAGTGTLGSSGGGDLSGNFGAATVAGIGGHAISSSGSADGQVLRFSGTQWVPTTTPTFGALWTYSHATGQTNLLKLSATAIGSAGTRKSPTVLFQSATDDGAAHTLDFELFSYPFVNAGTSGGLVITARTDAGAKTPKYSLMNDGALNTVGTLTFMVDDLENDTKHVRFTASPTAQRAVAWDDRDGDAAVASKGTVTTTDATETTCLSYTPPTTSSHVYLIHIVGHLSTDSTAGAIYVIHAGSRRISGNVSLIGVPSIVTTLEDDATWGPPAVDVSTTTVRVRVVGKAATTIHWTCKLYPTNAT